MYSESVCSTKQIRLEAQRRQAGIEGYRGKKKEHFEHTPFAPPDKTLTDLLDGCSFNN
jgi:hypothetical protein